MMTNDSTAVDLGRVEVRFDNLVPLVATLSDSTFLMLTGAMNPGADLPAWSIVTRAKLKCAGGS